MANTRSDDEFIRHDPEGLVRLDEPACWDLLSRHRVGRIAFVQLEHPVIFPVNYAIADRTIVFRTAPGAKLSAAARGATVAFEVDEVDDLFERGTSVIVHGHASEVDDRAERERLSQLPLRPWAPGGRDHIVQITPRWVSGRSIPMAATGDGVAADGG